MRVYSFFKNLFSKTPIPKSTYGLEGFELVNSIFKNLVANKEVPGISLTIFKDGEIVLQNGYGYSNLEEKLPIDPKNTIFRIASISKCITGLAFGKMVEEGILDWDDSFYKYVPYFPKKKYDFTLRQLAGHTAGIRGYRGKEFALNKPYSVKEGIILFKGDPLVFEPGKGYLYNSLDFVLLSLAMQEASGIQFEHYVKEKVLYPFGMHNTYTPNDMQHSQDIKLTKFYTKNTSGFKKAVDVNNQYKLAGGGYLSTNEDIAKMGQAILEKKLFNSETYKQLLTPQNVNGSSTYYGLGFQVSHDKNGRSFVGHVGNGVGTYTNFFVYPDEGIVISILINCSDSKVQDDLDKAINAVLSNSQNNTV